MRTLSIIVAAGGLLALSLTAASSPNEETLPSVPSAQTVVSAPEANESEVVEMRNWHNTAVVPPPQPSVIKRR